GNCIPDLDQPWLQFLALVIAMMKNRIELDVSQFEVSDFIACFRCRFNILICNCSAEAFIIGSSQNNQDVLAHKIILFLLRSCSGCGAASERTGDYRCGHMPESIYESGYRSQLLERAAAKFLSFWR